MYYKPNADILELCMEDLKNIELAFNYAFATPSGVHKSVITANEYKQFIKYIIEHTRFDDPRGWNWVYILETHINIEDEKEGVMLRIKYNKCRFRDIYINDESDVKDIIGLGACFDECYFDHVIFDRGCIIFARFSNTFFRDVSFLYTSLRNCVFDVCIFEGCVFHHCNILNCPGLSCIPLACPSHGGFVGWKKAIAEGHVLVKLYIPADAKRSSATSKKCRCSKAKVLDITSLDGKKHFDKADSLFARNFKYKVGEYVIPNKFDPNRWSECSSGIHFFINKQDAINY